MQQLCWLAWRFKPLFILSGVLSRAIMFMTSLLWPSGRKCRSSSVRYHADNVEVNPFFLNSPAYCKRSQSISDSNSSIDFLSFIVILKTAKDRIPLRVDKRRDWLCFPSSVCISGAKTSPSGRVNFEVWLSSRTCFCHVCGQLVASDSIYRANKQNNWPASQKSTRPECQTRPVCQIQPAWQIYTMPCKAIKETETFLNWIQSKQS